MRRLLLAVTLLAALLLTPAHAADKLPSAQADKLRSAQADKSTSAPADKIRVGKDTPQGFPMMALNVGVVAGIYPRLGIDVQEMDFFGASQMQTAIIAGELDIGLGGGPEMAYIVKGAPEITVAATYGAPVELGIAVPWDSPVTGPDGLKGKRIWMSTMGGLSHWLVRQFSRSRGWGPEGVVLAPLGANQAAQVAGLKTHQVDATITLTANGHRLEQEHVARLIVVCSDYVPDFISHAIFATNALAQKNPDLLRRFLRGWFESVAYMRAHKEETLAVAMPLTGFTHDQQSAAYDEEMPNYSDTGRFEAKALAALADSFVDVGLLAEKPDMAKLYTEEFLPN